MDNMQKGFLIAGGLLLLGFLGYTLFGKKEDEEVEDAEYYIVVDTNTGEVNTEERRKVSEPLASDKLKEPKISIVKKTNLELEEVPKAKPVNQIESFPKIKDELEEGTPQLNVVTTNLDVEQEKVKHVDELEVVKPQEIKIEVNDEFPLKLGSKGQRVWHLKVYLMKNHGGAGIITNDFDKPTAERVSRYLKVDEVSQELYKKLKIGQPRKNKQNATKKKY